MIKVLIKTKNPQKPLFLDLRLQNHENPKVAAGGSLQAGELLGTEFDTIGDFSAVTSRNHEEMSKVWFFYLDHFGSARQTTHPGRLLEGLLHMSF